MKVVKHSGLLADFDNGKLRKSLLRSGAGSKNAEEILRSIENRIFDGISTKEIYQLAKSLLKKDDAAHAARYNLRTALLLLGPTGFFFEKFVARLYQYEGYQTLINLHLQGHCVAHEIDIVMHNAPWVTMVECKFHNSRETNSDVKVPMYILSRFNDLKGNRHKLFKDHDMISRCLIATNNRFTADAITFAECSGLELLSWDYPEKSCLRTKIDRNALYPVTCLTTLSAIEKEKLLILDIILVRELLEKPESLSKIGISANRQKNIINESAGLCNSH